MPLKCFVNDASEVPSHLRDYYKKSGDGKFALVLDGDPQGYVKAEKLVDFRENNIDLRNELARFEGLDPDAARAALAKLEAFRDVDPEEYRVLKARPEPTQRIAELETQLANEKTARADTQLRNTVTVEFLRAGGRESAVDFMVGNATKIFAVENDELTTKAFSTKKPGEPLTLGEWMDQQTTVVDFAFKPSK